MKKLFTSDLMTTIIGGALIIMWFIGKNSAGSENNKTTILTIGILIVIIGLISIFIDNSTKNKPIGKIGYINKNDELNVMIRQKAANSTYEVIFLISWAFLGLTFSGILPFDKISSNLPLYIVIFLPLINIFFTFYYSNKL